MPYSIQEVIAELNHFLGSGLVEAYAIGGAIAASFYGEVASTEDIDVFVSFRATPESTIIDPTPVFDYFRGRGYQMRGDKVVIGGWPVQFLPPPTSLEEKALANAIWLEDQELRVRVISLEYLAAIALATGCAKDHSRLITMREEGKLDFSKFEEIIEVHGLTTKWRVHLEKFPLDEQ